MYDFDLAGLTEFDPGPAAGEGFAAGAEAEVLAAGAAAGAAVGAVLALVSCEVFFRDFLGAAASLLAAVWLVVALLSEALAALVSSALFFLRDFVAVEVSLLAAV